ncbi:MAG: M23 family metallopeptidase [Gammaproteobacteria bacterium]|nr:M23 family metallopeptidase [Gammaproteobacteria bacterium]
MRTVYRNPFYFLPLFQTGLSASTAVILLILSFVFSPLSYAEKQSEKKKTNSEPVVLINRGTDSNPVFDVRNNTFAPIEFELSADEFINMQGNPPLPIHKIIPANSTEHLSKLSPIQSEQPWSYTYTTRYVFGDPNTRHLTGKPYRLPFGPLKTFTVSQANDGERSHQHATTKYAVDIEMPEKTQIYAARTGTVIEITNAYLGNTKKGVPPYQVRILHNDGTMALYAHLSKDSATVHTGQKINRGQLIAVSGPSYIEGVNPHLHFAVLKNTGMKLESIPFKFLGINKTPITVKTGMQVRHPAY